MYVVGATRGEGIGEVRNCAGDYFFLVPGVGAQGGSLQDVAKYGLTKDCGLLVNSSRAIIYAGNGENFADLARNEAKSIQTEMSVILSGLRLA
jgi:orotidine-5'-phosphate decarboxylase